MAVGVVLGNGKVIQSRPESHLLMPSNQPIGEGMDNRRTRLLIPGMRPFYEWAEPVSWALVRLTAGLMIIPHGWPKVMAGIGPTAASALAKRGIEPAEPLAVVLMLLETVGGLCVAVGLFTRFFAVAIAFEMAVIVVLYFPKFGWT